MTPNGPVHRFTSSPNFCVVGWDDTHYVCCSYARALTSWHLGCRKTLGTQPHRSLWVVSVGFSSSVRRGADRPLAWAPSTPGPRCASGHPAPPVARSWLGGPNFASEALLVTSAGLREFQIKSICHPEPNSFSLRDPNSFRKCRYDDIMGWMEEFTLPLAQSV